MTRYFDIFSTIQIGDVIEGGKVVCVIDENRVVIEYELPCEDLNGNILRLKLVKL